MKSTFATELFVKLFGVLPPDKEKPKGKSPNTEVMIPNRAADNGDKVIYHVTPRRKDDRWNIKKEGGSRPSAVCDTKDEAINRAREIAHNLPWSQVVIHNKDGKIAHEYNYGGPPGERSSSSRRKMAAVDDADEAPDETESDDGFIDDYEGDEVEDEETFAPLKGERVIYHVTPRKIDGRWNVRRRGAERPSRVIENKEPAIEQAKEFAKHHSWSQVIVHNMDGKIANEFAYGGPPEDASTRRPTAKVKESGASDRAATQRVVWHVTPRADDGQWNIKREGGSKPTRVISKKTDAVKVAKDLARNQKKAQVVIHRKNGEIAEEFMYGDD